MSIEAGLYLARILWRGGGGRSPPPPPPACALRPQQVDCIPLLLRWPSIVQIKQLYIMPNEICQRWVSATGPYVEVLLLKPIALYAVTIATVGCTHMHCASISRSSLDLLTLPTSGFVTCVQHRNMVIPSMETPQENHYDHVHMRSRAVLSEDCTVCIASTCAMACLQPSGFDSALIALQRLGTPVLRPKPEQVAYIKCVYERRDVFVWLPTGSGE